MSVPKENPDRGNKFQIRGQVAVEKCDNPPGDLQLQAYAFTSQGQFLAAGPVNEKGEFRIPVDLKKPSPIELYVGPEADPKTLRQTSAYTEMYRAEDWVQEEGRYMLRPRIYLPYHIWWPWRPIRVCVSGHVRKLTGTGACPVPFVKVEIFDVDREFCWWPYIRRWYDQLIDKRVFRIPDIVLERPPFPDPIGPVIDPGLIQGFNPQPDPPAPLELQRLDAVALNPQPLPPKALTMAQSASLSATMAVGEMRQVEASVAQNLQNLTLTSKIAPWLFFPRCFYSRELVCETYTDCEGYFRCCFKWSQFHIRRGRLRFDARPDIIIRVTQIIDGVATVIYLDPYTSTRWNVTNTHIDLYLDNEEVRCGSPNCDDPVAQGSEVFLTRVGDDDVYKIHQGNGLYPNPAAPGVDLSISNLAYGSTLKLHAAFGDTLADGVPKRYYRLSYARQITPGVTPPDAAFQPITMPASGLKDTRVAKGTFLSETYDLGPKTVGTQHGLYEVRDTVHYHWYHQGEIGDWVSGIDEPDTGRYVLRLEVFDQAGNKLNTSSGQVDYRDGTHIPTSPPTPLPAMIDHCDMVITLDNQPVKATLTTPATNSCGVVPWVPGLTLPFGVHVAQGNGRVHSWGLYYTKGTNPAEVYLGSGTSNNGLPDPVNTTITVPNSHPMINGLNSTCAFAIKLWGRAHVTDGRQRYIFYDEDLQAIAIEKCHCP